MRTHLALALLAGMSLACRAKQPDPPAPLAPLPGPEAGGPDAPLRPVYDRQVPPDPRAVELCRALHAVPAEARARCEGHEGKPAFHMGERCVAVLSTALADAKLVLDAEKAKRCVQAMSAAYATCAPFTAAPNADVNAKIMARLGGPLPAACADLIDGTLDLGAACQSSLECKAGFQCFGSGPMDAGRCTRPGGNGSMCNTAVDALAAYTRQDSVEVTRPACQGWCDRNRCVAAIPKGEKCVADRQCAAGTTCHDGRCS